MSRAPLPDHNTILLARVDETNRDPDDPVLDYSETDLNGLYVLGGRIEWSASASHRPSRVMIECDATTLAGDIAGNYAEATKNTAGFRLYVEDGKLKFGAATSDGWFAAEYPVSGLVVGWIGGCIDAKGYRYLLHNGKVLAKSIHPILPTSGVVTYDVTGYVRARDVVSNLILHDVFRPWVALVHAGCKSDPGAGFNPGDPGTVWRYNASVCVETAPPRPVGTVILTPEVGLDMFTVPELWDALKSVTICPTNVKSPIAGNGLHFTAGTGWPVAPSWSEGRHYLWTSGGGSQFSMLQPLTVEAWVKIDGDGNNNGVFCGCTPNFAAAYATRWKFSFGYGDYNIIATIKDDLGAELSVSVPRDFDFYQLTYCAFVWEPTTPSLALYGNGRIVGQSSGSVSPANLTFATNYYMGASQANGRSISGTIHALRMRQVQATEAEIFDYYNGGERTL